MLQQPDPPIIANPRAPKIQTAAWDEPVPVNPEPDGAAR